MERRLPIHSAVDANPVRLLLLLLLDVATGAVCVQKLAARPCMSLPSNALRMRFPSAEGTFFHTVTNYYSSHHGTDRDYRCALFHYCLSALSPCLSSAAVSRYPCSILTINCVKSQYVQPSTSTIKKFVSKEKKRERDETPRSSGNQTPLCEQLPSSWLDFPGATCNFIKIVGLVVVLVVIVIAIVFVLLRLITLVTFVSKPPAIHSLVLCTHEPGLAVLLKGTRNIWHSGSLIYCVLTIVGRCYHWLYKRS